MNYVVLKKITIIYRIIMFDGNKSAYDQKYEIQCAIEKRKWSDHG